MCDTSHVTRHCIIPWTSLFFVTPIFTINLSLLYYLGCVCRHEIQSYIITYIHMIVHPKPAIRECACHRPTAALKWHNENCTCLGNNPIHFLGTSRFSYNTADLHAACPLLIQHSVVWSPSSLQAMCGSFAFQDWGLRYCRTVVDRHTGGVWRTWVLQDQPEYL